jgi:Uma2 family endonuclease
LAEAGQFGQRRVQLLEGVVVEMSPMGNAHAEMMAALTRSLVKSVPDELRVRVQLPLAIDEESEPEPDLAVVRHVPRRPELPGTALFVIEVADSSRALDLGLKAALYARAKIAEYWVIDLSKNELVVHRTPRAGRYTSVQTHGGDQRVVSTTVESISIQLDQLGE